MKKLLSQKKFLLILIILFILIGILLSLFIVSSVSEKGTINYASNIDEIQVSDIENMKSELKILKSDFTLGDTNAPIQMISYDSFSCHHCANFFENVFPEIDEKYIKTGKVLFVHRDFPLDIQSLTATKLMKCALNLKPEDESVENFNKKAFALILSLYQTQKDWINTESNSENLYQLFQVAGLKKNDAQDCTKDEELENRILEERLKASKILKITGTPTFFINGKKFQRNYIFREFENEFNLALKD
jgi:protein-disulfide isomerase